MIWWFHPEALVEYREAALRYERVRPELGRDFKNTVEKAIASIREHPTRFGPVEHSIRRCLLKRFPYKIYFLQRVLLKRSYFVVYFLQEQERSVVVAVLDARRDPRAIRKLIQLWPTDCLH